MVEVGKVVVVEEVLGDSSVGVCHNGRNCRECHPMCVNYLFPTFLESRGTFV